MSTGENWNGIMRDLTARGNASNVLGEPLKSSRQMGSFAWLLTQCFGFVWSHLYKFHSFPCALSSCHNNAAIFPSLDMCLRHPSSITNTKPWRNVTVNQLSWLRLDSATRSFSSSFAFCISLTRNRSTGLARYLAPVYFVTFIILGTYLMLNVFVAIVSRMLGGLGERREIPVSSFHSARVHQMRSLAAFMAIQHAKNVARIHKLKTLLDYDLRRLTAVGPNHTGDGAL